MRFLVFQHIDVEHPGIFRKFMTEAGITWDAVELDEGDKIPSLDGYDALMVMGGPMDVWEEDEHPWLIPEKAAIKEAVVDRQLPYLGLCLGHQLLAVSLDGEARLMPEPEVGILEVHKEPAADNDPLFASLPATTRALQWHGVEVSKLPAGAVHLARSPKCALQAMRLGAHAYGIQYHVELTEQTVPEWADVPAYKDALAKTIGVQGAKTMETEAAERIGEFNQVAKLLFDAFVDLVEAHRRGSGSNAA